MTNLADRIELFLKTAFDQVDTLEHDEIYQESFADDGERKSTYILERLFKLEREGRISLAKMAYVSLGGADGSELFSVLRNTQIKLGVLVEVSDAAIAAAEESLKSADFGDAEVLIIKQDAVRAIPEVYKAIRERGFSEVCISAQAILHELPDRSDAYKTSNRFLGSIFGNFERTLFVSREPCEPDNWPEEVEVSIPEVSARRLADFVAYIGKELRLDFRSVDAIANKSVIGPRNLIVEALHKLLRSTDPASLRYELGEQLTSFDAAMARDLIASYCDNQNSVELEYASTDGFRDAYREAGVFACDTSKRPLPMPNTHARLIAFQHAIPDPSLTQKKK